MQPAAAMQMPLHDRNMSRLHPQDGVSASTTFPRSISPNLQLEQLPRFHPANFPGPNPASSTSSNASLPALTVANSTASSSPKQQYQHLHSGRQYIDLPQRQLFAQQKEAVNLNRYVAGHSGHISPHSHSSHSTTHDLTDHPRLQPRAGSPSPMTPLDLEDRNGYFNLSTTPPKQSGTEGTEEETEAYIRGEIAQARPVSPIDRRASRSPRFMAVKKGDMTRHRSHLSR